MMMRWRNQSHFVWCVAYWLVAMPADAGAFFFFLFICVWSTYFTKGWTTSSEQLTFSFGSLQHFLRRSRLRWCSRRWCPTTVLETPSHQHCSPSCLSSLVNKERKKKEERNKAGKKLGWFFFLSRKFHSSSCDSNGVDLVPLPLTLQIQYDNTPFFLFLTTYVSMTHNNVIRYWCALSESLSEQPRGSVCPKPMLWRSLQPHRWSYMLCEW